MTAYRLIRSQLFYMSQNLNNLSIIVRKKEKMKRYLFFIPLFFLLASCATSPTGRSQLMLVSPEQAISASKAAYLQTLKPLSRKGKVDSDPLVSRRVKDITGRIIYQAIYEFPHTANWEWSVKVIDEPETVNAWCMAGGKMAVYTGLLNKLNITDDELAQVIGHEISHAVANHTAEKMSIAKASQLGILGVALASQDAENRAAIMGGTILAAQLAINLPHSRIAEAEADVIGMKLAALAGYNPRAAVTLWQKMANVGGSRPPEFLSTHPSPANRQSNLRRLAEKMMPYYLQNRNRPIYPVQ